MRLRKKPWVREELNLSKFYIKTPIENIGNWKNLFNKKQPIHIELGCGKGRFISKLASQSKNINYIAIDIKSEVLGLTKRNIEQEYLKLKKPIDNILITIYQIEIIKDIFNKKDKIERIYINFCNPWPKQRHNKKRLTYPKQLKQYKNFLTKNGEIYFKTDNDELFEKTFIYLEQEGFEIINSTKNLNENNIFQNNIITEHEKMFLKQGIKIKAIIAKIK